MAFLVNDSVIINDQREAIGVNTAGIVTSLFVGSEIEMSAGIITATRFVGSGASLTQLPSVSWIDSSAPATRPDGEPLQEGDIYYDSTKFRQFTYYDGDGGGWRDSNPASNNPLDYSVDGTERSNPIRIRNLCLRNGWFLV